MLWLDYAPLVFRVKAAKDPWFQVVVNNSNGKTYWVKKNTTSTFYTWEAFLKNQFSIARLKNSKQIIRKLPTEKAAEIIYKGEDCFQVKAMKGDWIEIFSPEHCKDEESQSNSELKSGWTKWREGNKLLIEYFITS